MPRKINEQLVREVWKLHRNGEKEEKIAEAVGFSTRQVHNYLDREWLKERKLGHLQYAPVAERHPITPLQEKAWGKCQDGDHSWMDDGVYADHAFKSEAVLLGQNFIRRADGSVVTALHKKVCYFCGYEKTDPLQWFGFDEWRGP